MTGAVDNSDVKLKDIDYEEELNPSSQFNDKGNEKGIININITPSKDLSSATLHPIVLRNCRKKINHHTHMQ